MSYGVASNQIQAALSAKSSSSLLHPLHIKKRLWMGKWAQLLIHFNRCTSVDYKSAGHGERGFSTSVTNRNEKQALCFCAVAVHSGFM